MSIFEFVLAPLAIIIGFGISEILKGWGQQIHNRRQKNYHPLQIASSALILFASLAYLWAMWLIRDIAWTFQLFLLIAIPGYAIALAAYTSSLDNSADAPPILEQYFQNCRPIYGLLATLPIAIMASPLLTNAGDLAGEGRHLAIMAGVMCAILGLLLTLAWSRSEKYHLTVMVFTWLILTVLVFGAGMLIS